MRAGGIGGLLVVRDHGGGTYHFVGYDGNGNVTVLVNASDQSASAQYEYSPFGELIRATGPLATTNPFRWSTKFWEEESGLVYYGYRYYSPSLGRWINRDPFEEEGGNNFYAFVFNEPIDFFDTDGRSVNQILSVLGTVLVGAQVFTAELIHGNWTGAQRTLYETYEGIKSILEDKNKAPPRPESKPRQLPKPPREIRAKGKWVERRIRGRSGGYRGGPGAGAGLAVGGIFLGGSLAMANSADELGQTFKDYAHNLARGETAWADLDVATFAAQLSGGGADYFFTMGTFGLLITVGDIAASRSGSGSD
jgi:RHS repeat-associated protein